MNLKVRKWIKMVAVQIIIWPLALVIFSCSCADKMIFHPSHASYATDDGIVRIPVTAKEQIAAMYRPADPNSFVLLFSHGNEEDIGQNEEFFELANQNGFGILAYDYRGYGLSDGRAGEKNTYQDISAAYRYLTETLSIPPQRIIILGQSVGSGPSVWLATQKPAAGLILESPFVSAFRVVTKYKILPFDPYNNLARIKKVQCPVLIIHGKQDKIVFFWHGLALYEAANEPKMNYWVEDASHNDVLRVAGEKYWAKLNEFTKILKSE